MIRFARELVVVTALVASFACPKVERFEEIDLAKLPQIDYCELRNSPDHFDGKVVRINSQIANFGHGYYFKDERCSKKVYEELLDDDKTAVEVFEPRANEIYDALQRVGFDAKPTNIVAVGRFTRKYPSSGSDHMSDRTSFHFEPFSLEPASK